jgi:hypothetical protein
MRRRLGGWMAALMLCLGTTGEAAPAPVDCGSAPDVKCLAAEIFSLAKTLPDDSYFRRHVSFAERELAPGDIKTALDYVVSDNPDSPPWEDIEWIARAGRFDAAIKRAKQRSSAVERLGGLLAVVEHLLDKNDKARAQKILEDVEGQLPSIPGDAEEANSLLHDAGELWVQLGQIDRAVRLMRGSGIDSVSALLASASKYPAAASLREQAWREAERASEPYAWQLLLEDAKKRGDRADLAQVAERASQTMEGAIDDRRVDATISLARAMLEAGVQEQSAKLVKPWIRWVKGKDTKRQSIVVNAVIVVLAGLALDQDVLAAADAVSDPVDRSRCLSSAGEEYFRIGRSDVGRRFEIEALRLAISSPTGNPEQQWKHDAAIHNLSLVRADHGNILGALDAASELRDETKIHEVTAYIARRAIDNGHGPVAAPAIEVPEQQASATRNVGLLLKAANDWYEVGDETKARRGLDEAMTISKEGQSGLAADDLGVSAELMWRINGQGKAEAMLGIIDRLQVNDPNTIDHLVEIIRPVSPAVAVQLAGRQAEVERRIDDLASIAVQIAAGAK